MQAMAQIGFIGLGNMGLPMAQNLLKAGHRVTGFDLIAAAVEKLSAAGGVTATTLDIACVAAEVIITMLPSGKEVRDVYSERRGVLAAAEQGTLLIDCSTTDVDTPRVIAAAAQGKKLNLLDAPVSGGVAGAT